MIKNLFSEYLFRLLFSEYYPIYFKCCPSPSLRRKAGRYSLFPILLLLLVIMLSCITGCVQNYKYADAYIEAPSTHGNVLKESSFDVNTSQEDDESLNPRMHLELDFQPKVSGTLFSLSGNLVLWGNTTLPYLMLNATLWGRGLLIGKTGYMLIHVEPGKKYTFDISQNQRLVQGEYDCILEASGPYGSLFSEKRRCSIIYEPVEQNLQDLNPDAEEKSMQDVSESSKMGTSVYKIQGQNGNAEENKVYDENSAVTSAERSTGFSDSSDRIKASMQPKKEPVGVQDTVGRKILPISVSKNASVETNRMPKENLAATKNNKGEALAEGVFVGSSGSNKYHRPDCRFVDKIKNKIYFKSAEEARKNGKVPCKTCNPP